MLAKITQFQEVAFIKMNGIGIANNQPKSNKFFLPNLLASTFQELELRTRRERQNGAEGLTARAVARHTPINFHVDLISDGAALAPTFVVLFHLLPPQV